MILPSHRITQSLMIGLVCALVFPLKASVERPLYNRHQLGFYLDSNQVSFVRPGPQFVIQSVVLGADLKPRVTFKITDDNGLPLDRDGIYTPGSVSTSFVAARIPAGQSQYVAYTTRTQTSPITGVSYGSQRHPGGNRLRRNLSTGIGGRLYLYLRDGLSGRLR